MNDKLSPGTRRTLLLALGAVPLCAVLPSLAQPPGKVWRVGVLSARARRDGDPYLAFPPAMRELGYVEGRNLAIEWRYADDRLERLPALAEELARLKVDVIVASTAAAAQAAQNATRAIPIVMVNVGDPVGSGLVKSLAWPGGNMTGLSNISADLSPKHLEMLLRVLPRLSRVAMLVNPGNPGHRISLDNLRTAAQARKVTVLPFEARTPAEIESAFSGMAREKAGALVIGADPIYNLQFPRIAALAAKGRLPAVAVNREFTEAGGLMSYGADFTGNWRRAAAYADKIFKGAKPADLPVEQPTRFEMIVNRRAAKALGVAIPQELVLSADRVIE